MLMKDQLYKLHEDDQSYYHESRLFLSFFFFVNFFLFVNNYCNVLELLLIDGGKEDYKYNSCPFYLFASLREYFLISVFKSFFFFSIYDESFQVTVSSGLFMLFVIWKGGSSFLINNGLNLITFLIPKSSSCR